MTQGLKIAIISESPADEAAIRELVRAAVSVPVRFVQAGLRARGWPSVSQVMPAVLRHLHFNTDTDVLVSVCDADDSVVHTEQHERPDYFHPQCRICKLRAVYRQTMKHLPPAQGRDKVLRAVGVAVPAIEGWYLCGKDTRVTEEAWNAGGEAGARPYTRAELKWRVYGTDRPTLQWEIEKALEAVARHAKDTRRLENDFFGFHLLARDLRAAEQHRREQGCF